MLMHHNYYIHNVDFPSAHEVYMCCIQHFAIVFLLRMEAQNPQQLHAVTTTMQGSALTTFMHKP